MSTVPVWGCPWHGLVSNGQLPLPNGQTMPWPQPGSGQPWERGSTALVRHPDAAPITRTPDEAAADAADGRQWRNQAMISGGTIYGRSLSGGWLYIDPAGDVWWATTTLSADHVSGGTCDVRLRRFGVIGGAPEEYTYEVTVPDMGQASPSIPGDLVMSLYHSAPTGAAAVFELAVVFGQTGREWWSRRPVGWIEITLAGPGSSCSPVVSVLRNRAQTLGTYSETPSPYARDDWFQEFLPDASSRLVREPPTGVNSYLQVISHRTNSGQRVASNLGYIVGMIYSEAGQLQEITLDEELLTSYDIPPAVHTGATEFAAGEPLTGSWSASHSTDSTLTITYRLDGAEAAQYVASITESVSDAGTISESSRIVEYTAQTQTVPAGEFSTSGSRPDWDGALGGGWYGELSVSEAPYIGGSGLAYLWPGDRRLQIVPCRQANGIFGLGWWWTPVDSGTTSSVEYLPAVLTPAGAATLPALELSTNLDPYSFGLHAYASWCPVTGQAARAADVICWV